MCSLLRSRSALVCRCARHTLARYHRRRSANFNRTSEIMVIYTIYYRCNNVFVAQTVISHCIFTYGTRLHLTSHYEPDGMLAYLPNNSTSSPPQVIALVSGTISALGHYSIFTFYLTLLTPFIIKIERPPTSKSMLHLMGFLAPL